MLMRNCLTGSDPSYLKELCRLSWFLPSLVANFFTLLCRVTWFLHWPKLPRSSTKFCCACSAHPSGKLSSNLRHELLSPSLTLFLNNTILLDRSFVLSSRECL